jgi:serine/threonine-protein kinase
MIGNPEDKGQRIQVQLDRILSSKVFSGSERHRKFLRFLVEQALKGSADRLNEFVLGFEVFNKGDSFDPRIDSIVRVEARRLRERLKKYYQEEGRNDSLVITLRPRSFEPEFSEPSQAGKPSKGAGRVWFHSHRRIAVTAAVFVCGIVAAVFALPPWWRRPSPPPPGLRPRRPCSRRPGGPSAALPAHSAGLGGHPP